MAKNILQKDTVTNSITWLTLETGTGSIVYATSPTLITPALGVATATTLNKVTLTQPAASATLTIANTMALIVNNTVTLTGTTGSILTFGTGGTLIYASNNISALTPSTSAQFLAACTDESGTGLLVFNNAPTFIAPVLGVCTGTSFNGLTINNSTGALTVANGGVLATVGAFSLTLTTTAGTNVTLPVSGTLYSTLAGSITSAQLLASMTDETGTGSLVFGTAPTIATANLTGITSIGDNVVATVGVQPTFKSLDQTGGTGSQPTAIKSGTTVSANSGSMTVSTGAVQTAGNSGAVSVTSGASSTVGDSGAANLLSASAVTGNTGLVTVASGASTTLGATGNINITTGVATAGLSGSIIQTTGSASTIKGAIFQRATTVVKTQGAPTTQNAAGILTTTQVLSGIITVTQAMGATIAITLPTGADLAAALPSDFTTGDSFELVIINLSAAAIDTATLTLSAGISIVGKPIIDSAHATAVYPSSAIFRFRMSAAGTFVAYRLS